MVGKRFRSDRERDPIAELALLIAQADQESAPSDNRFREEAVSDGYDETPELPPAPQLAVDQNEQEQACERDEHCSGAQAYDVDDQLYAAEEEYQDSEVPHGRRHSLTLVMAMFGLALVDSACAVGYRNMYGGSVSPTLPPAIKTINERSGIASVSEPQAASSGNTDEIGPATTGSIDNVVVSREEQPATIGPPKAAPRASLPRASAPARPAAGQAVPNRAVRSAVAADPPAPRLTVAAASERPGQSNGAGVIAALDHDLDVAPVAQTNANSTAVVTAPVLTRGYAVQVTSERSEGRAQATFRALQTRYPNELSGHQPNIRRADLGAAGIYYRALVGPFASAEKAAKMCSRLKAAGGDCIIQKN